MGADVLGIDAVERSVAVARAHAARDPAVAARARYRTVLAEALQAEGARFDGVLSLEVVEHVADVRAFTAALAGLVAPRGLLVLSTVNRTLRSYALGVLAAERLLGLVPPGTHDWARFLTPAELAATAAAAGFELDELAGMVYSPLARAWRLSKDTQVNYIASFQARGPGAAGGARDGASTDRSS
jgi:2-polyprenyl-6-hydroxyphenyl methylase/3-demethylubiquinone-9 3-methyltransferase